MYDKRRILCKSQIDKMAKEEGHIMDMFTSIVEEVVNDSKWQVREENLATEENWCNMLDCALALYLDWTDKAAAKVNGKIVLHILLIVNTAHGEERLKQRRQGRTMTRNECFWTRYSWAATKTTPIISPCIMNGLGRSFDSLLSRLQDAAKRHVIPNKVSHGMS